MDPALLDPLVKLFGSAPWLGYVAAVLSILTTLVSLAVTAASFAANVLEDRSPDGSYIWPYPRLRSIAHWLARTPKPLLAAPVVQPPPPSP